MKRNLRVDAEYHDVLPEVPRANHFYDARPLGVLWQGSV